MMGNRNTRDWEERVILAGPRDYGKCRSFARVKGKVKRALRRGERRSAKQARYSDRERGSTPVELSHGELLELLYE